MAFGVQKFFTIASDFHSCCCCRFRRIGIFSSGIFRTTLAWWTANTCGSRCNRRSTHRAPNSYWSSRIQCTRGGFHLTIGTFLNINFHIFVIFIIPATRPAKRLDSGSAIFFIRCSLWNKLNQDISTILGDTVRRKERYETVSDNNNSKSINFREIEFEY